MLQDFKVRFLPSFVVITLCSSPPQTHMHCFSDTPDFTAHLFTHFPNIASDRRYGTTAFSPSPLTPFLHRRSNLQHNASCDAKCSLPPRVVCYRILEDEAGVRDEHEMLRVLIPGECARFDAVVLDAYKECLR